MLPLESVPNVSEGRDDAVVAGIASAFAEGGARVLDVHSDPDHHRSVLTLVAASDAALVDALVAGIAEACERIDLRRHDGAHPRVGAADVVPLVPLAADDEPRAESAALELGARLGDELGLPVFLYGAVGEGRRPAFFRRGGLEALRARVAAGELAPAFGPSSLDPRTGAVLVGARAPLVAFNVVLDTEDVEVAEDVARVVRASGGGLPGLQAIGLRLRRSGIVQVSTNVVDVDLLPLRAAVERIRAEAAARGVAVARGELVGLVPARVVAEAASAAGVPSPLDADGLPTDDALRAAAGALALDDLRLDRVLEAALRS